MSMLDDKSNMVPLLQSKLLKETDKAFLIEWEEKDKIYEQWFPKSQCKLNKVNQYCIPQWLYDKVTKEE